jgi:putative ABC transport system permease protein
MTRGRAGPGGASLLALLATLAWPEWRSHPWRQGAALLAVTLGVALAFSVHLINASALAEFGQAVQAVNGQPDLALRPRAATGFGAASFDEALYARAAAAPGVALASPVIEVQARAAGAAPDAAPLRVVGIDALVVGALAPGLLPHASGCTDRLCALDPTRVFLNAAAQRHFGSGGTLTLNTPGGPHRWRIAGSVAADGPPLAVIDIAAAQDAFGLDGRLSRIDLRLAPGADAAQVLRGLQLPANVRAAAPDEADHRIDQLSRAYRVNLTVLALVALFTGAYLVFSVMALSVARRVPQFALLGVLGLAARERLQLVLAEGALLGAAGSALGLALGTALAQAALRWRGGDLGGGYFQGLAPTLRFDSTAALLYAALGTAAALVGSVVPARQAQRLAPAQALKGLGLDANAPRRDRRSAAAPKRDGQVRPEGRLLRGGRALSGGRVQRDGLALRNVLRGDRVLGPLLLALALALSFAPPIDGLPIAAYLAVACGLVGGIACVPAAVGLLVRLLPAPRSALLLLAVERAREQRTQASVAVAGVVAALSLGVALTVMVGSFRSAVTDWLQHLLPADLYLRVAAPSAGAPTPPLPPTLAQRAAALPGVQRVDGERLAELVLDPQRPPVALIARPLPPDAVAQLPLVGALQPVPAGSVGVFVSEAVVDLYGARPGGRLQLPLGPALHAPVVVRGVWRDYARQTGSVLIDLADYRALSGDRTLSGLALWLAPQARLDAVEAGLRALAPATPLEFATTRELRAMSLRLFDRSFAVTSYLQALAIAIGLFGIAASFSAQVLARRKEFGMLAHLGVTRRELLTLIAAEGAVWTAAGTLLGLALGLAVSVVLVDVVNPQSFHWTMPLSVPWARLAALCALVLAAGTVTALLAGRAAAGRAPALAVKEDW